jgi:hypothetical protein
MLHCSTLTTGASLEIIASTAGIDDKFDEHRIMNKIIDGAAVQIMRRLLQRLSTSSIIGE